MHVSNNTVLFRVDLPDAVLGPEYADQDGKTLVLGNAVSGAMDVVTTREVQLLDRIRSGAVLTPTDEPCVNALRDRGYVYDTEEAADADYRSMVDGYFEAIQQAPFQFMFIPSFVCNLACPYCFEGELTAKSPKMSEEMIEAAFDAMPQLQDWHENSGQPYVSLFGGEPLLDTSYQRWAVEEILRRSYDRGFPTTVITNGVALGAFVPMLSRYECEEVQVSLDGPAHVHDERRIFRGGKPTFHLIERSIDTALEGGLRVLIRLLVDHQTVKTLPEFAEFAKSKGWLESDLVTVFFGFTKRTDFLYVTPHHPTDEREKMVAGDLTMGLQEEFYRVLEEHPLVDEMLHADPARIRAGLLEGDRIHPNLQGCSAGTSVIAFDPSGRLYGCPETVGRVHHSCGSYFPELSYDESYREPWRRRHVDTVPMCRDCNVKLFCGGGGCPIKAWAISGGEFDTCYCPKVETVRAHVERELRYLLPRVLRGEASSDDNSREQENEWQRMKRTGSFPWMS